MCVKLRKSTVVVIITSWILFFIAAFLAYAKLDQMKQERLTNEKIFQQTTQKNTSQGVIRETNDVVEPYVVTSGEGTPQPEPDGRAENRAVVTEGVVFSVFAVGIRPRRQGGDEIGVDGPPDGCGSQSVGHGRYYDGLQA